MTTTDTRPDIPIGYTYDDIGNEITFKDSDDYWYEYTYGDNGDEVKYKNSRGYWREYTRDTNGRLLTRKDSDGVDWTTIAHADGYTLGYDAGTHKYRAGCRVFTRAEALAHWGTPRDDNAVRAAIFVDAINNHKETT